MLEKINENHKKDKKPPARATLKNVLKNKKEMNLVCIGYIRLGKSLLRRGRFNQSKSFNLKSVFFLKLP